MSAARAAPGVVAVVTGADLPEVEAAGPDKPLAVDRVFYTGQPVVAIVAESETAAADAASLVEIELEALALAAAPDDACFPRDNGINVRWVMLHMIEETARHAGYADLIREAIDGRVGT